MSDDLLDAMRALGGDKDTVALVPNGVDAERFSPGPRAEARARLDLAPDGPIVLCVGHLIERKDPLLALASFARHAPESARLVFVGRGPLEDRVAEAAREAGVSDRVQLVGERPPEELVDWYRAADVLLLTSSREGRPNVVLEALSSGCPVIATDAGGTAEVLPGDENLIRERDPDAVGRRLAAVLDDPPSGEDLRASVAHLTWDAGLDALERVLRAVAR